MEKSSFFDAEIVNGEYDRVYLSEDYAKYFSSFIGNGIFLNPSNNLKVTAEGGNMKAIVKVGKAWINGYYYENDSDLTLIIDNADGVLNRIDRIVLRLDLAEREISVKVKKGEYSSNAIPQEIERNVDVYELAIADIKITNGALSINNSDITDLRLNTELCGIVHGTVEQVDTTEIFNTYEQYLNEKLNGNEFNDWFMSLKNKLDPYEDIALQLQLQIAKLEEKMNDSLKTDGTLQENLNADMLDGKHANGDLVTNEKNNLVSAINEVFTNASNGKTAIANAITGKGVGASGSETFDSLSSKIGQIANDTTAAASDVLTGKSVYIQGKKATGTMANRSASTNAISVGSNGTNKYFRIPQGAYLTNTSTGYPEIVVSATQIDSNIVSGNIKSGVSICGVTGTAPKSAFGVLKVTYNTNHTVTLGWKPDVLLVLRYHMTGSGKSLSRWVDVYSSVPGLYSFFMWHNIYSSSANYGSDISSSMTVTDTGFTVKGLYYSNSNNYDDCHYMAIKL